MNLTRRNPYTPTGSTILSTQTDYPPLTPVFPSAPSSAATSAVARNAYGYGDVNSSTTIQSPPDQYPSSISTSTAVPIAHLEISTPSQGAIITISVICGLLLLALLFTVLITIGRRYQSEQLRINIEGGGGGGEYHGRRRHRSEKVFTGFAHTEMEEIGRERGNGGMERSFFGPGPGPNLGEHEGVPPGYFMDPRMGNMPHVGRAQGQERREDVEEVEESETSTTRAGGARTQRSGI